MFLLQRRITQDAPPWFPGHPAPPSHWNAKKPSHRYGGEGLCVSGSEGQ
jgi:hypothetical protein